MITDLELFEKLRTFEWLLRKKRFCSNKEDPFGDSSKGQGRIISVLSIEDGLKTKELALRIGINTSSLNEILSKMEKGGYIKRYPSKDDKRVIINSLTSKGRKIVLEDNSTSIFDCLDEQEKKEFISIFDKLNTNLEESIADDLDEEFLRIFQERKAAFKRFLDHQENLKSGKENPC